MPSIVLQLQRDIVEATKTVTQLLRTAKLIAAKLQLSDVDNWIDLELGGYKETKGLPEYRVLVGGTLHALNPYRGGWQLVGSLPKQKFPVCQPVSEVEDLAGDENIVMHVPASQNVKLQNEMGINCTDFRQRIEISSVQFKGILSAIRNKLLEWSIELEKRGILGSDISFNDGEVASARNQTFHIQQFTGVFGNVSTPGSGSHININSTDNSKVRTEIAEAIEALRTLNRENVVEPTAHAKIERGIAELESAEGDKGLFQSAYLSFMSAIADHIQIFTPVLPALAQLAQSL